MIVGFAICQQAKATVRQLSMWERQLRPAVKCYAEEDGKEVEEEGVEKVTLDILLYAEAAAGSPVCWINQQQYRQRMATPIVANRLNEVDIKSKDTSVSTLLKYHNV